MPIAALPPNAIRAIGSTQALTDPASVVKELIDNALDGGATTISVEISADTLNEIRVKDNGHGITPNDRAWICTRYCTSKIRNLDDLRDLGGRSLGFRGEALASLAEMSGSVTISTRIEGEGTAVELIFNRQGQVAKEKRTSLPVGTTVRVEKFLENLPVRKQAALKTLVRTLAKVKRIMQAYALARPYLKLSLRVLKAKNEKGNWKYPKSSGTYTSKSKVSHFQAATDIFGRNLTDQCQLEYSNWSSTSEQIATGTAEISGINASRDQEYLLEATLAKQDCEASVISSVGQYLSVDSRPISCARGISKQIIALYKSYLRSATSEKCDAKIVDPFLCLNIACPLGSYDVNVEPAKDDLLFINADPILQMAEHCFKKVYGELGPSSPKLSADRSLDTPRGIGLLLARDRPAAEANAQNPPSLARSIACNSSSTIRSATRDPHFPITSDNETFSTAEKPYQEDIQAPQGFTNSGYSPPILEGTLPETSSSMLPSPPSLTRSENTDEELNEAAFATKNSAWRKSMYPDEYEDDDLEEYHDTRPETPINIELDECNGLRDVQVSNPWAFAKINAPFRPPARQHCGDVAGKGQLPTPGRQVGDIDLSADLSSDDLLQEGRAQTLLPAVPLPLKARGKRKTDEAFPNPAETNEQRYGRGSLDTWVQKSFSDYPKLDDRGSISPSNLGPPCLPRSLGFVSARTLQQGGIPLGSIPDMSQKPPRKAAPRKQKQGHIDKPFISPVNDPERVWFDTDETPQQKQRQQTQPRKELQNTAAAAAAALMLRDDEDSEAIIPRSLLPPLEQTPNDVAAAMDFEARKRKWVLERKKSLRQEPAAQKRNPAAADPADATLILEPPATKTARASPHKNRQAAAIKALHPRPDPIIASPTHEDMPADPRPPTAEPRPQIERSKRRKSALLPLETLHKDAYVGDLSLMLKTTAADIAAAMEEGWAWDGYIQYGEVGDAFGALSALEVAELEARIGALVRGSFAAVDGARGVGVVDFDLRKILRAHAADVGFD